MVGLTLTSTAGNRLWEMVSPPLATTVTSTAGDHHRQELAVGSGSASFSRSQNRLWEMVSPPLAIAMPPPAGARPELSRRTLRLSQEEAKPRAAALRIQTSTENSVGAGLEQALTAGLEELPEEAKEAAAILRDPDAHAWEELRDALNQIGNLAEGYLPGDDRQIPFYELAVPFLARYDLNLRFVATDIIAATGRSEALEPIARALGIPNPGGRDPDPLVRKIHLITLQYLAYRDAQEMERVIEIVEQVVRFDPGTKVRDDAGEALEDLRNAYGLAQRLWNQDSVPQDRKEALRMLQQFHTSKEQTLDGQSFLWSKFEWVFWRALKGETDLNQAIRLMGAITRWGEQGGSRPREEELRTLRAMIQAAADRLSETLDSDKERSRLQRSAANAITRLTPAAGLEEVTYEVPTRELIGSLLDLRERSLHKRDRLDMEGRLLDFIERGRLQQSLTAQLDSEDVIAAAVSLTPQGEVRGYVLAQLYFDPESGTSIANISELAVVPAFRDHGVARDLVGEILDQLDGKGWIEAAMIEDESSEGQTGKISEHFGFEETDRPDLYRLDLNVYAAGLEEKEVARTRLRRFLSAADIESVIPLLIEPQMAVDLTEAFDQLEAVLKQAGYQGKAEVVPFRALSAAPLQERPTLFIQEAGWADEVRGNFQEAVRRGWVEWTSDFASADIVIGDETVQVSSSQVLIQVNAETAKTLTPALLTHLEKKGLLKPGSIVVLHSLYQGDLGEGLLIFA